MGKKVSTKLRFKNQGDIEVVKNCAAYINMDLSNYTTRAVYEFTKAVLEQRKQHAAESKAKAEALANDKGVSNAGTGQNEEGVKDERSRILDAGGSTEATSTSEDASGAALANAEADAAEAAPQ